MICAEWYFMQAVGFTVLGVFLIAVGIYLAIRCDLVEKPLLILIITTGVIVIAYQIPTLAVPEAASIINDVKCEVK